MLIKRRLLISNFLMLFLPVSVSVALLTFAYFLTKPLGNASKNYSFEDFVCVCREIMP